MTTENNENELMTEEATNTEGTTVQTAGEENTESGGTDAGTDENLPLADQKKAINLQDLIYVKKYINDQVEAFKNKLISDLTNGTVTVKKATNASTASDAAYAISAGRATKDSDGNVIKDTYYKKTDTVANATNANYATSAGKATNDENGNNIASTYRKKSESVVGSATVVKTFSLIGATGDEDYGYKLGTLLPSGIYLVVMMDDARECGGKTVGVVRYSYTKNSQGQVDVMNSSSSIGTFGTQSGTYYIHMWTLRQKSGFSADETTFFIKYGDNLITNQDVMFIKLADLS